MAEIIWSGHSCFRLRGKDATIVTDPFDRSIGLELKNPRADIVTVSSVDDTAHNAVANVRGEFRVLRGPGEYEVKGVFITGVSTYADNKKGAERGKNTVFLFELDDLTICHLGNLGHVLTTEQVEALSAIHVLLVPVGGNGTLDAAKAAEVIAQLEPRIVIPMHFRSGNERFEADTVEKFAAEMGLKDWRPQDKLVLKHSDLPETTSVVVLEPKN